MATMQALLLKRPDPSKPPILSLETVPKPKLEEGHLLIQVQASAIHPSDLLNSTGSIPQTTYPRIPGRDFSGLVVSPPSSPLYQTSVFGTSGNSLGFTTSGTHAEYLSIPCAAVFPKPSKLTHIQAATIGVPFSTAALILQRAGLEEGSGETVLVLGANGAVGSAVVQVAEARGAKVFQGTRNDNGDVNTSTDPEFFTLHTLTGGKGVEIIIDTVGSPALLSAATKKIAQGGRVVFIAAPRGGDSVLGVEMTGLNRSEGTLVGVNSLRYGAVEMGVLLGGMSGLFESGVLKGSVQGTWNELRLEEGVEAYKMAGERGRGKFVLVMQ